MSTLVQILVHDIAPILVVIGLGYVFTRRTQPELRAVSRLTFYVLSPALVFTSLAESNVAGDELLKISGFVTLMVIIMGVIALGAARALRLQSRQLAGFLLAAMFVNGGNYGLGINRLAFGPEVEARAVIYFVTSSILVYTVGVAVASGFAGGWRGTLKQLVTLPHVYAMLLALLVRVAGWTVPQPIMDGVQLPAQAAIPMMLLLLGAQLAYASVGDFWKPALAGSILRLMVAPLVAVVAAAVLGLSGPARQATILQASMPAAVINTILAAEYNSEPRLVTGTVVISTLISPFTLTILIALLQ